MFLEFDIRFNPDVFSPGVRHPNTEVSVLLKICYNLLILKKKKYVKFWKKNKPKSEYC